MKGVKSLLSSRGNNIIKSLCKNNGGGTIKELAKLLNISERSIRYELDKIDDYFISNKLKPLKRKFGENTYKKWNSYRWKQKCKIPS